MLPEYACCPPRFDHMTLEERRELQGESLKAKVRRKLTGRGLKDTLRSVREMAGELI